MQRGEGAGVFKTSGRKRRSAKKTPNTNEQGGKDAKSENEKKAVAEGKLDIYANRKNEETGKAGEWKVPPR